MPNAYGTYLTSYPLPPIGCSLKELLAVCLPAPVPDSDGLDDSEGYAWGAATARIVLYSRLEEEHLSVSELLALDDAFMGVAPGWDDGGDWFKSGQTPEAAVEGFLSESSRLLVRLAKLPA